MATSPWVAVTRRNESALIRLYVLFGVGTPAASYLSWVSAENCKQFPEIEVVILDLPGHGDNPSPAFFEPFSCAKALAETIEDIQFRGQKNGDVERPFALYGFSMGANFMWQVARSVRGRCGEKCSKLYVCGRGAPNVDAAGVPLHRHAGAGRPDLSDVPVKKVLADTVSGLRVTLDSVQADKYHKYLSYLSEKEPEKVIVFAETQMCDNMMAGPGFFAANDLEQPSELPRRLECPVQTYFSDADEIWPLKVEGNENENCNYDNVAETWRRYAPENGFDCQTIKGLSHGQMGSPETPVYPQMMADLTTMMETL